MILVSHTPDEVVEGVVEGVFEGVLEGLDRYLPGIRGGGGVFNSRDTSPDLEEVPTRIKQVSNKYYLPRYLPTYLPRSRGGSYKDRTSIQQVSNQFKKIFERVNR